MGKKKKKRQKNRYRFNMGTREAIRAVTSHFVIVPETKRVRIRLEDFDQWSEDTGRIYIVTRHPGFNVCSTFIIPAVDLRTIRKRIEKTNSMCTLWLMVRSPLCFLSRSRDLFYGSSTTHNSYDCRTNKVFRRKVRRISFGFINSRSRYISIRTGWPRGPKMRQPKPMLFSRI